MCGIAVQQNPDAVAVVGKRIRECKVNDGKSIVMTIDISASICLQWRNLKGARHVQRYRELLET